MPSDRVAEKALAFLDQRRVRLVMRGSDVVGAVVLGETEDYNVWFTDQGVVCECYASTADDFGFCSHKIAAMITVAEMWQYAPRYVRMPGAYA